jgi:hypothetical protein
MPSTNVSVVNAPPLLLAQVSVNAYSNYGQQLCQNPRSIQKYCAYVLVLPTFFSGLPYWG